ncbi:hypothetical protein PsorP6_013389 [Peronosclerospora sorghi]|uniref:Uncharacterized protein n=1 Tax=Peronosclerospora sorghi TaxID=230839 RepID=A0ACC0WJA9_9STRA|nr:hypothetical protein PsorP6_013389 [Peronosclerospora sorghi]
MRRDVSRERLFYFLVLIGALLLISGLMLRSENNVLPKRTFRDGFTVAEDVVRPTEIVPSHDATYHNVTNSPTVDAVGRPDASDVRTTTIKTEDGDEITIKRATSGKGNKITTISRDEKGKLTIEDKTAENELTEVDESGSRVAQNRGSQDRHRNVPLTSSSAIQREMMDTSHWERVDHNDESRTEPFIRGGDKKLTNTQTRT